MSDAEDGFCATCGNRFPAGQECNGCLKPKQQPDPAPIRFEDAEIDALAVIVDRMAVLEAETDSGCVHRVIRYLRDRYGTDG